MVVRKEILEQIWGGDLVEAAKAEVTPLTGILASLTKLPVVTLTSSHEAARPFAMLDGAEVLEGVSLGDALAEELELEVPIGALVLVQPKGFDLGFDVSAQKLGEVLGAILLEMSQGQTDIDLKIDPTLAEQSGMALSRTAGFSAMSASRLQ